MEKLLAVAVGFWILGLLQGWWARSVYDWVHKMVLMFKDRLETPSGVVRPTRTRGTTRGQQDPIDLTAKDQGDGGVIMRPTPDQVRMQRGK